ncbi:MAG: insulinase family protein [Firmicutes bacterium]|nr:insulinase family protein [Bacillota bacterium]
MKEIELKGLDQNVFYKKLKNGLEVYMIPYENKTNYAMHYITKYGSNITEFIPLGKKDKIKIPEGTAHFLEHKMYEQEDGIDPFTFAAKTGTSSNASTSYKTTRYFFEGNSGFDENLDFLLKFIHSPYFTDENVEKEKGIISEEIRQYDDEIDWVLDEELRKSIFQKDNTRNDIGGTVESIQKITKETLYDTYNTFYQPSNMILVISGSFDKERALDIIENHEILNKVESNQEIIFDIPKEPLEVKTKIKKIEFNVVNKKVGHSIKIPLNKVKDKLLFNLYLGMMNNIVFGLSSKFRETMKNQKLMTSFYMEREIYGDYLILTYVADSEQPEKLIEELNKRFESFEIEEQEIERLKKVWISSEVVMVDNISMTLDNLVYDIITYGNIVPNKVDVLRSLNKKDLDKILKSIDFTNSSTVYVYPKKESHND